MSDIARIADKLRAGERLDADDGLATDAHPAQISTKNMLRNKSLCAFTFRGTC